MSARGSFFADWPVMKRTATRKRRRKPLKRKTEFGYELSDPAKNAFAVLAWGNPANLEVYDPYPQQKIPAGGAWAMITRPLPAIEGDIDKHFRVGRVFYLERPNGTDADGFSSDGTYKAQCRSPWGDLCLWPYEYAVIAVEEVVGLWAAGELVFHPTRIDSARLNEIAFYARSRGIGLADAAAMALGTLSGSVGWFEPREDLAEDCEALAESVHRPLCVRVNVSHLEPEGEP